MDTTDSRNVFYVLTRILLLGIGGALAVGCTLYLVGQLVGGPSWATTQGFMTSAQVMADETTSSRGIRPGRTQRVIRYRLSLSYSYAVGGRQYSGHTLGDGYNPLFDSRSAALAALAPYSSGRFVTVYYDPADPDRSALELGGRQRLALIFGGIGLAMAIAGWLMGTTDEADEESLTEG